MTPVVYKATNKVNGKKYIGVTVNFRRRQLSHKYRAKTGSNMYFHNAIRKYGWESFDWEILYEGDGYLEKEIEYIQEYKTHLKECGYNSTLGGEGAPGYRHDEKTKKLIGKHSLGNTNTLGKTWKKTAQAIQNSTEAHRSKWEVTSPEGEVFIISGLREFSESRGLYYQNLWKVAAGRRKHTKGYTCRRLEI